MVHIVVGSEFHRPGYRYTEHGVSFPDTARPRIKWGHVDGPLLVMRDGSLHWLTLWERFMCWLGLSDALVIELRRRPDLASDADEDTLPCMFCGKNVPPGSEIGDDYGGFACDECGTAEIAAQRAEGMWPR